MKRPSRRTVLIASISAAAVVAITAGTILGLTIKANADAHAEYDAASASLAAATEALNTAQSDVASSQQQAALTAQNATDLAAIADPTLLADAATVDALESSVEALMAAAELVDTEGTLTASPPLPAVVTEAGPAPTDRATLLTAAADLRTQAKQLAARAKALDTTAAGITAANAEVDGAAAAVVTSAQAFGAGAATPVKASAESVAAFSAALEALAAPAAGADLTTLMLTYRDAWYATVASDAAARSAAGAATATYIRGILIVNKTYGLPSTFGSGLTADTSNAFATMKADAAALGLNIYIASGFRSFASQTSIYNRYKANEGEAGADAHSARPGHSEHQSGLAFDLNSITQAFGSTPEGIWVRDNAHRYGFIVRYPEGKQDITGYIWEPWHLRYVGVDVATQLHDSGQTLEEYLGVTSVYN